MQEAAGKAADPNDLNFDIFRQGDRTRPIASALSTASATLQLPSGVYEVTADYAGARLGQSASLASFEVKEGQSVDTTINLKVGRVQVEIDDAPGRLSAKERVSAQLFPAGQRDQTISSVAATNPLSLVAPAGGSYDIVLQLDTLQLVLPPLTIGEGVTSTLKVNASDFK